MVFEELARRAASERVAALVHGLSTQGFTGTTEFLAPFSVSESLLTGPRVAPTPSLYGLPTPAPPALPEHTHSTVPVLAVTTTVEAARKDLQPASAPARGAYVEVPQPPRRASAGSALTSHDTRRMSAAPKRKNWANPAAVR